MKSLSKAKKDDVSIDIRRKGKEEELRANLRPPAQQTCEEPQKIIKVIPEKDPKGMLIGVSLSHEIIAMQSKTNIEVVVVSRKDIQNSLLEKHLNFNRHLID